MKELDYTLTGCFMIILEVMCMLIDEIAKKYHVTKKAVQYYVEQGMLVPDILENGYKNFSKQDEIMFQI